MPYVRRSPGALRPYGPSAWYVEPANPAAWAASLVALGVRGVVEVIPAEASVVVTCDRDRHAEVGVALTSVTPVIASHTSVDPLVIDVVYSGADLAEVAASAHLSEDEVVRLHSNTLYEVAFCGFSPGFGYLRGLDDRLHMPRRETPRRRVPAGSVGVAAGYSCVYPSASPGGWHLLGRTDITMWDLDREPPALMIPGRRVRFRSVPG